MYPLIRSKKNLERVYDKILENPGIVLCTIVDDEISKMLEEFCSKNKISYMPFMNNIVSLIETETNTNVVDSQDEEIIECEEGAPPCDVLSSWVYDAYISNEFDEVVNEARHAIACNCAVTHADQIYAFLARAYVELDEDNKAVSYTHLTLPTKNEV